MASRCSSTARRTATTTTRPSAKRWPACWPTLGLPSISRSRPWASTSPSCGSGGPTSTCSVGATAAFDSHNHFVYLYRSDGQYNATGYADPRVDELIDAIATELVTYGRDAMIEEVWRTVLADVVVVPLHHQVMVWALRDRLELPIDALDLPRFRLARIKS